MRSRNFIPVRAIGALVLSALLALASCEKPEPFSMDRSSETITQTQYHHFTTSVSYDHVVLLYQAGFNSLSRYLEQNVEDLYSGYIPSSSRDVLLLLSHLPERAGRYSVRTSPLLLRIEPDFKGNVQVDTLVVYPETTVSSSSETVRQVLTYVRDRFPSDSYGLILCSHASGWLPEGYYADPDTYEFGNVWSVSPGPRSVDAAYPGAFTYVDLPAEGSFPAVRSFGQDRVLVGSRDLTYEIDMADLAAAIPMHLDYILFDACLMGCVEVAYQLKDVCDKVGFSPAEVLAEGFVYDKIPGHLLGQNDPDLQGVLNDFFEKYDKMDGSSRSATISLVDCTKLDRLASVCADLIGKYRTELQTMDTDAVQRYFRHGRNYFYDLQDIFVKAGISSSEASSLESALSEVVLFKAATPKFIDSFQILSYSGLSMYLPAIAHDNPGRDYSFLNRYYRESVAWNAAVGLVR